MSKVNSFLTLFAASVIVGLPAYSQESYRSEVTVQGMGSFVKDTTQSGVRQSTTNSGGFLAGYRFYFTRHIGAEINYGYTLNTQNYRMETGTTGIKSYSHETTGALVYSVPFKRFSIFALAGAGAIVFNPKNVAGADYQADLHAQRRERDEINEPEQPEKIDNLQAAPEPGEVHPSV